MILYFGNLLLKEFSFEEAYWSRLVKEGSGLVTILKRLSAIVRLGGLLTLNVFSAKEQLRAEITSCPEMKSICHSIFQIF
jgi:hypothetical protein